MLDRKRGNKDIEDRIFVRLILRGWRPDRIGDVAARVVEDVERRARADRETEEIKA